MKKEIFAIPIFEDKVDLKKIEIPEMVTEPTWDAGVPSTFAKKLPLKNEAYEHLSDVINRNLYDGNLLGMNPKFGHIWYNRYDKHHYQDAHLHPNCQWSFIIYVSVTEGRTVFMNPSRGLIMNQWAMYGNVIPMDFVPQVPDGHILIFPSWIEHFAMSGNEGETIAGNVYLKEPPIGLRDERKTRQGCDD